MAGVSGPAFVSRVGVGLVLCGGGLMLLMPGFSRGSSLKVLCDQPLIWVGCWEWDFRWEVVHRQGCDVHMLRVDGP